MTNNQTLRPTPTIDSIAAYLIAETTLYAMTHRDDYRDALHAFADEHDTLAERIDRFIDIDLDELTDNDTLLNFADTDDATLDAILNSDELRAMLTTAYTELAQFLNID